MVALKEAKQEREEIQEKEGKARVAIEGALARRQPLLSEAMQVRTDHPSEAIRQKGGDFWDRSDGRRQGGQVLTFTDVWPGAGGVDHGATS